MAALSHQGSAKQKGSGLYGLSEEELASAKAAFHAFDKDGSGSVDVREVKQVLSSMHQQSLVASDEDIIAMFKAVDVDGSGAIDFNEFCMVISQHKDLLTTPDDELVDAFVAMGGNADRSGFVSADKLRATVQAFELTLDIEALIDQFDKDGSGQLDFFEFRAIVS